MNFRVALAFAAVLTFAGVAQAQTPRPTFDRVVVHIDGKPMPAVRAELWSASQAVCRSDGLSGEPSSACVYATYGSALRRAKLARAAALAGPKPTTLASR